MPHHPRRARRRARQADHPPGCAAAESARRHHPGSGAYSPYHSPGPDRRGSRGRHGERRASGAAAGAAGRATDRIRQPAVRVEASCWSRAGATEAAMTRAPSLSIPMIALGAAGAFALASLLHRRIASAASMHSPASGHGSPPAHGSATMTSSAAPLPVVSAAELPPAPSSPAFRPDFGRPVPLGVRAVVGSGWAGIRGTGPTRRLHRGLDIGLPIGTPILAIDQGVVTHVHNQNTSDAGIWAAVRHPSGITSRYIHLSRTLVKVDQLVQRGELIGLSGDTASPGLPHLHLDLRAPAA